MRRPRYKYWIFQLTAWTLKPKFQPESVDIYAAYARARYQTYDNSACLMYYFIINICMLRQQFAHSVYAYRTIWHTQCYTHTRYNDKHVHVRSKYLKQHISTIESFRNLFTHTQAQAHSMWYASERSSVPPRLFHRFYMRAPNDIAVIIHFWWWQRWRRRWRHRWYSIKTKQWLNQIKWCVCEHQSSGHNSYNSCDSWW